MATYNGERFIIEQLESIRNQSVSVDEVIINDDGSTDRTVVLINNYIATHQLNNWKVFTNKHNLGFSKNFYKAVKKTNGDIVFLADQDDIWLSNKVEVVLEVFNDNKDLKIVATGQSYIDSNGEAINNSLKGNDESIAINLSYLPFKFFLGSSTIPGCTMCIHKEIRSYLLKHDAPDLSKSFGHDWYFSIVGSILGKFGMIDNILIKRRIHENNASKESLRKLTVLTTTLKKREIYLEQIINAHLFILNNSSYRKKLKKHEIHQTKQMVSFFKKRLNLLMTKNIFIWFGLLFSFFKYYHCAKSLKIGFKLCMADLFYTYNINWKLTEK